MILFDGIGHMVSTVSLGELHQFAAVLRLKREWFQSKKRPNDMRHYDLTTARARQRAAGLGAIEVDPVTLISLAAPDHRTPCAKCRMPECRNCTGRIEE